MSTIAPRPARLATSLLLFAALPACGLRDSKGVVGGEEMPDLSVRTYDLAVSGPVDLLSVYNADAACGSASAKAEPAKRALDLIVVIDNSGSMADEIHAVENNVNDNLARILEASGIDYRIIFLTAWGEWTSNRICIGPPLSKVDCNARPLLGPPQNGTRYFHYDYAIDTNRSLNAILETYRVGDKWNLAPSGWAGYLRAGTQKVFVEISDDRADMNETDFDFRLRALDQRAFFTDKGERAYVFHSIVGLRANNPINKPWGPDDPFQPFMCSNNVWSAGEEFQNLSILTRGLRYPICQYASFNTIFQEFASVLIDGAKLQCEIDVPDPPPKKEIDFQTLLVEFTPSDPLSLPEQFAPVKDATECGPGKFYLKQGQGSIVLCPDTCNRVQADLSGALHLLYNCVEIM